MSIDAPRRIGQGLRKTFTTVGDNLETLPDPVKLALTVSPLAISAEPFTITGLDICGAIVFWSACIIVPAILAVPRIARFLYDRNASTSSPKIQS